MHILLAEDDERLGKLINHMLQKELHVVDWVKNGDDAYDYARLTDYDCLVLDWMMPRRSGIEVCKQIRKNGYQGGILFITAKDSIEDMVLGLDSGADDYIVKPFQFEELLARLRAVSRRKEKVFEEILQAGNLKLNMSTHTATKNEEAIDLSRKEYHLLELLLRNKNQVIPREILFEKIWGFETFVSDNALDSLVKLVRKKIDTKGKPSLIKTVRGIGYLVRDCDV
ncbi:response regulator transcription factor [Bacillus sp. DNRA2]|uniref:response regulator transcription factor n=1 Tax=Bacillus sp. DNRA2 TaxID=2723053 RepID=UPI00145D3C09|nr:response regulator transcription factor [Bacillus sp. DNRA2]NMD71410.1 response regulator transcription factor [Bacillus sp. DNRA2]